MIPKLSLISAVVLATAQLSGQTSRAPLPYNETKTNFATGGSNPRVATTLFQMVAERGRFAGAACDRIETTMQFGTALAARAMTFSFVGKLASGAPGRAFATATWQRPAVRSNVAFRVTLSLARPAPVPAAFGVAVRLVPGEFLQGQLSGVRVPSPWNRQVWAYDQPTGVATPRPLGSPLSMLRLLPRFAGPTLHGYVMSNAYGTRQQERLDGPEAWHPVRSRGDTWGCELIDPQPRGKAGVLFVSPARVRTPLATPFGPLALPSNALIPLASGSMPLRFGLVRLRTFPAAPSWWLQAVVVDPRSSMPVTLRNAIGIDGI